MQNDNILIKRQQQRQGTSLSAISFDFINNLPFEDLYQTKGKDIILKLMKPLKTRVFQTVKEIQLKGIQKCFIAFS